MTRSTQPDGLAERLAGPRLAFNIGAAVVAGMVTFYSLIIAAALSMGMTPQPVGVVAGLGLFLATLYIERLAYYRARAAFFD